MSWTLNSAIEIIECWDAMESEAGQASQIAQDPQAGMDVMIDQIVTIILRNYAKRSLGY